ncbi:hypothetical protein V6N12_058358 [Hibiscus sabdariffa]|uniref:Uncharacterized protein n=1 Tax=Hibiscus sabdariffa TaxID=183260 RepID=A0ABR2ERX4_9ROSI
MLSGSSSVPTPFYHSPHMFPTSAPPLLVFPPLGIEFNSKIVQQTSPGSLFITDGPSGNSGDDYEDANEAPRRNLPRDLQPPWCGTGGHRLHWVADMYAKSIQKSHLAKHEFA